MSSLGGPDAPPPPRATSARALPHVAPGGALGQRKRHSGGRGERMLLVTGGAGFIGSNVVASLNEAGRADVVVNDELGSDQKWRNLGKRQLADVVPFGDLFGWLANRKLDAVIHLGAISAKNAIDDDR